MVELAHACILVCHLTGMIYKPQIPPAAREFSRVPDYTSVGTKYTHFVSSLRNQLITDKIDTRFFTSQIGDRSLNNRVMI